MNYGPKSVTSALSPQIPVIDVEAIMCGWYRESVARDIIFAANTVGAFQVINHGINTRQILDMSKHFLGSSTDKKMAASKSDGIWGHFGLLGERTQGAPDMKEGIYLRSEMSSRDAIFSGFVLRGPNKWPCQKDFPKFKSSVESHFDEVDQTAHAICRCISSELGWGTDYFSVNTISTFKQLGMFRYHKIKDDSIQSDWGVGAHSDRGLITMVTSDAGGLQVQLPDANIWFDVPVVEGAVIILVNDYLDYITNGYCKSSVHRVLKPTSSDRYSVTTFVSPHFDLDMSVEHIGDGVSDHVRDIIEQYHCTSAGEHATQQLVYSLTKD
ncbi:probable iron/ascorbate oxidoreductase DDB_G0283291 isoform X2 [Dysidea avara]